MTLDNTIRNSIFNELIDIFKQSYHNYNSEIEKLRPDQELTKELLIKGEENHFQPSAFIAYTDKNIDSYLKNKKEYSGSIDNLKQIILDHKKSDGALILENKEFKYEKAYIYDRIKEIFEEFNVNDYEELKKSKLFFSNEQEMGGKKLAAFALSYLTNCHTFVLSQTRYDGTGMGKLMEFGSQGVEREFYFLKVTEEILKNNPKLSNLPKEDYFDPEKQVIAVLRTYNRDNKTLTIQDQVYKKEEKINNIIFHTFEKISQMYQKAS